MAYWSLTTYSRPDKSKEWWLQDTIDEIKAESSSTNKGIGRLIVALENAGKITHYSISEANDGLKQYIKIGFDNKDTFDKFIADMKSAQPLHTQNRDKWVEDYGLTSTIQNKESEPTITL